MDSKKLLFIILLALCTISSNANPTIQEILAKNPRLFPIGGPIDNKSYFGDTVAVTWQGASAYCESISMELATIKSVSEANHIKAAFASIGFGTAYWTGGKDRQTIEQFDFLNGDGSLIGLPLYGTPALTNCVAIYPESATVASYRSYPCATTAFRPLCQTKS